MTLYEHLAQADITLNDEHHIYIHKRTGEFYNSMTGALSLFKAKFDDTEILNGLHTQYTNFHNWYFRERNAHPDNFVNTLSNWVNYKEFRTPTGEGRYGKMYRRLQEYASPEELNNEMSYLKEVYSREREKNIYLKSDFAPHSKAEMKVMWKYLTDIANHYGNMVHVTNERTLLQKQGINNDGLYRQIIYHYTEMYRLLDETKTLFPYSSHSFQQYYINIPITEFIEFLQQRFLAVKFDAGRCIVPEKVLLYNKLAGMTDVYIDICDNFFDIGDHKTNKDYTFKSLYGNKLLPPFDHLEECEHNLYTLQANGYTNMIENTSGKKGRALWITYFDRKKMDYDKIEIERKKEEADYIINAFHKWQDDLRRIYLGSSLGEMITQKIPEKWMNHFLKQMNGDVEKRRKDDEFDGDRNKWKKHYIKFIDDYIQTHKHII